MGRGAHTTAWVPGAQATHAIFSHAAAAVSKTITLTMSFMDPSPQYP